MGKNKGKRCIKTPGWRTAIYASPTGRHHKPVSLTIRFLRLVEPWTRRPSLPAAPKALVS
jgi:hypothetical protein